MSNPKFLTKIIHTTSTVNGKFLNLFINEDQIDFFTPIGNILCCESNYGRNLIKNYNPGKRKKKKIEDNRKYKRKRQGNGTQMSSQIQFHVKSHYNPNKIYKIKVYRNETFQVPGVLKRDFTDVMSSLIELRNYFRNIMLDNSIEVDCLHPILSNYKCKLINTNLIFKLSHMINTVGSYKQNTFDQSNIFNILDNSSKINKDNISLIKNYIPINRYNIAEIKLEQERVSSVVTIKFYRPSLRNKKKDWYTKRSTIKVFQSGKINLDAVKTYTEVVDLYAWLNIFILNNYNKIIYDITSPYYDSSDDSDNSDNSDN